jgi:NAD(P)-dependent dehydrogenase (short-subunit alcohol dehydrogenase family)
VGDRCFCDSDGQQPARRHCPLWYKRLRTVVEGRLQRDGGVGVLVNCAGACYPYPEFFAGMSADGYVGARDDDGPVQFTADYCSNADVAIRCNVAAAVHACRLVLPGMLARGRGLVINVGSASASMPPAVPLMALYAATKKFLEKLSADLDAECAYLTRGRDNRNDGHGVRVQCARPAYVATAMLRSANPDVRVVPGSEDEDEEDDDDDNYGDGCWWASRRKRVEDRVQRWLVPSARRWVRSALRQGGRLYTRGPDSGPANYTGYWPHTLMVWCARLASAVTPHRWFVDRVLIPGMLVYRAKGRAAIAAEEMSTSSAAVGRDSREETARRRQEKNRMT